MKTLSCFKDIHKGETIIVCGCGSSLNELPHPEQFITIGVNDVGRRFHPNYLVILNPRSQFKGDRFHYVATSQAQYLFTQLDPGPVLPPVVRFRLGKRGGTDFSDPNVLHYTQNSPYVALCLAVHMGAKRIGLIGVDFTDNHFFKKTGRHVLSPKLTRIDAEYKNLQQALSKQGIEIINLSSQSRLTAFKKEDIKSFCGGGMRKAQSAGGKANTQLTLCAKRRAACAFPLAAGGKKKIFFVNYKFLSCGDVFRHGLKHAAQDLDIEYAEAYWDDNHLPDKIRQLDPDLVFVVHGRKFTYRWKDTFKKYNTAVWLLDEPYEVDDTSKFSGYFDTVFVNDPGTISCHKNAFYLPVCYDPVVYCDVPGPKEHDVGFIGGHNPIRQQMLEMLVDEGLLSYVIGGPWKGKKLNQICLSGNIPHEETAALYKKTKIILNIFRSRHHFNARHIPAASLNPRVYEAIACGAVVVSENRTEIKQVFPQLPVFENKEQMVHIVRELLQDEKKREKIKKACMKQLKGNTYSDRLKNIIDIAIDKKNTRQAFIPNAIECVLPQDYPNRELILADYSIIMVVHNSLDMVKMSTLRTLAHSVHDDACLIIVDNASDDGTEVWLDILARKGDIRLIRCKTNIGHGPGIELARREIRSPFIVTLDSDAFPLTDDWLQQLRSRLNHRVKIAGILHHRDYIHPSCLMISRQTLEDFNLSFLNEKDRPGQLDVAERISCEIKRRGFKIAGLEKTTARRRGSVSEPVYLGSNYEGVVYHQWYTTREFISQGRQVDDVPREALERSLKEVLEEYYDEPREISVVVGIRAAPRQPQRVRNVKAVLWALNLQTLQRWHYRIVIVEQDIVPRLKKILEPLCDRYIFAYNPGPYNRSWAFNIGAVQSAGKTRALCFLDADLLVPPDFLSNGLKEITSGLTAVCPYSEVIYLDPDSTDQAIKNRLESSNHPFNNQNFKGTVYTTSQGGTIWVEPNLYFEIGGHNEDFRGWGGEDREFWDRLVKKTDIKCLPGRLFHLYHPEPNMQDPYAAANQKLYRKLSLHPSQQPVNLIGDLNRYTLEVPPVDVGIEKKLHGMRDWENWHKWTTRRIENIVFHEKHQKLQNSARYQLVQNIIQLGNKILDIGCGPGALWPYLAPYRPRVSWVGIDITHKMLKISQAFFPQVPVCNADAGNLPFGDNSFDVVVLRHVLDHLPPWLMCRALRESMRVAIKSIVLVFYVPPVLSGSRKVRRVGENFLETQWTVKELENILLKDNWRRCKRLCINGGKKKKDTVWVINPTAAAHANADKKPMPTLNEKLKISIIMPTYKRPHSIFRTVETIRQQVYNNWELIIIDNEGGTGYDFHDPRIRLYCHNARVSASYARNQGLKYATGNLVCFFDDDDDMFPGYLKCFAHAFQENPDAKMVRCGMIVSNGKVNFSYATPECCLRREFATPNWPNKGPAQDQFYFKQIISRNRWSEKKGDIIVINEALCRANREPYGGLRSGKF